MSGRDDDDPAARPRHAEQLRQGPLGLLQVLQHPLRPAGVERAVRERQGGGVPLAELHRQGLARLALGAPAGLREHRLADVHPHRTPGGPDQARERPDILAGAAAHVEHPVARTDGEQPVGQLLLGPDGVAGADRVQLPDEGRRIGRRVDPRPPVGLPAARRFVRWCPLPHPLPPIRRRGAGQRYYAQRGAPTSAAAADRPRRAVRADPPPPPRAAGGALPAAPQISVSPQGGYHLRAQRRTPSGRAYD